MAFRVTSNLPKKTCSVGVGFGNLLMAPYPRARLDVSPRTPKRPAELHVGSPYDAAGADELVIDLLDAPTVIPATLVSETPSDRAAEEPLIVEYMVHVRARRHGVYMVRHRLNEFVDLQDELIGCGALPSDALVAHDAHDAEALIDNVDIVQERVQSLQRLLNACIKAAVGPPRHPVAIRCVAAFLSHPTVASLHSPGLHAPSSPPVAARYLVASPQRVLLGSAGGSPGSPDVHYPSDFMQLATSAMSNASELGPRPESLTYAADMDNSDDNEIADDSDVAADEGAATSTRDERAVSDPMPDWLQDAEGALSSTPVSPEPAHYSVHTQHLSPGQDQLLANFVDASSATTTAPPVARASSCLRATTSRLRALYRLQALTGTLPPEEMPEEEAAKGSTRTRTVRLMYILMAVVAALLAVVEVSAALSYGATGRAASVGSNASGGSHKRCEPVCCNDLEVRLAAANASCVAEMAAVESHAWEGARKQARADAEGAFDIRLLAVQEALAVAKGEAASAKGEAAAAESRAAAAESRAADAEARLRERTVAEQASAVLVDVLRTEVAAAERAATELRAHMAAAEVEGAARFKELSHNYTECMVSLPTIEQRASRCDEQRAELGFCESKLAAARAGQLSAETHDVKAERTLRLVHSGNQMSAASLGMLSTLHHKLDRVSSSLSAGGTNRLCNDAGVQESACWQRCDLRDAAVVNLTTYLEVPPVKGCGAKRDTCVLLAIDAKRLSSALAEATAMRVNRSFLAMAGDRLNASTRATMAHDAALQALDDATRHELLRINVSAAEAALTAAQSAGVSMDACSLNASRIGDARESQAARDAAATALHTSMSGSALALSIPDADAMLHAARAAGVDASTCEAAASFISSASTVQKTDAAQEAALGELERTVAGEALEVNLAAARVAQDRANSAVSAALAALHAAGESRNHSRPLTQRITACSKTIESAAKQQDAMRGLKMQTALPPLEMNVAFARSALETARSVHVSNEVLSPHESLVAEATRQQASARKVALDNALEAVKQLTDIAMLKVNISAARAALVEAQAAGATEEVLSPHVTKIEHAEKEQLAAVKAKVDALGKLKKHTDTSPLDMKVFPARQALNEARSAGVAAELLITHKAKIKAAEKSQLALAKLKELTDVAPLDMILTAARQALKVAQSVDVAEGVLSPYEIKIDGAENAQHAASALSADLAALKELTDVDPLSMSVDAARQAMAKAQSAGATEEVLRPHVMKIDDAENVQSAEADRKASEEAAAAAAKAIEEQAARQATRQVWVSVALSYIPAWPEWLTVEATLGMLEHAAASFVGLLSYFPVWPQWLSVSAAFGAIEGMVSIIPGLPSWPGWLTLAKACEAIDWSVARISALPPLAWPEWLTLSPALSTVERVAASVSTLLVYIPEWPERLCFATAFGIVETVTAFFTAPLSSIPAWPEWLSVSAVIASMAKLATASIEYIPAWPEWLCFATAFTAVETFVSFVPAPSWPEWFTLAAFSEVVHTAVSPLHRAISTAYNATLDCAQGLSPRCNVLGETCLSAFNATRDCLQLTHPVCHGLQQAAFAHQLTTACITGVLLLSVFLAWSPTRQLLGLAWRRAIKAIKDVLALITGAALRLWQAVPPSNDAYMFVHGVGAALLTPPFYSVRTLTRALGRAQCPSWLSISASRLIMEYVAQRLYNAMSFALEQRPGWLSVASFVHAMGTFAEAIRTTLTRWRAARPSLPVWLTVRCAGQSLMRMISAVGDAASFVWTRRPAWPECLCLAALVHFLGSLTEVIGTTSAQWWASLPSWPTWLSTSTAAQLLGPSKPQDPRTWVRWPAWPSWLHPPEPAPEPVAPTPAPDEPPPRPSPLPPEPAPAPCDPTPKPEPPQREPTPEPEPTPTPTLPLPPLLEPAPAPAAPSVPAPAASAPVMPPDTNGGRPTGDREADSNSKAFTHGNKPSKEDKKALDHLIDQVTGGVSETPGGSSAGMGSGGQKKNPIASFKKIATGGMVKKVLGSKNPGKMMLAYIEALKVPSDLIQPLPTCLPNFIALVPDRRANKLTRVPVFCYASTIGDLCRIAHPM